MVLTDEQREMVLANVPLVEHIVNRMAAGLPSTYSRDDLVQTGIMGLISATVRFDPNQGSAFSTFAGHRIEGAIIDLLRRADWAPRSVRALERRLASAEEATRLHRSIPSGDQLSKVLGIERTQLDRLRQDLLQARLDSLDRPVGGDDGAPVPLSSTIVDRANHVEEALDNHELVGYLREGVALLPERHRSVIFGYFFEGKSMTELGAFLGVSQSRASQIKDEALKLLRSGLAEVYGENQPTSARPTNRQRSFADSLASSQGWRERVAAGKGISVAG